MPPLQPEIVAAFRPLSALVPSHWRTGATVADDGTNLHWTETGGREPAVVLLHGAQVDGLSWLRTARALESRHRVVFPDLRGHGRSGRFGAATSSQALVDDVRAVLDAATVDRPIVVGHSMGAEVAARLAAVEELRGVVLVDPPLQNLSTALQIDLDAPPPWMQFVFDTLRELKTQAHSDRMVTGLRMLPPGGPYEWEEDDYVSFVEGLARFDLDLYRSTGDASYLVESPDVIAAIACPILLLTARPMVPGVDVDIDAGVAAFARHWRDGRHIHFPDSGHAIQIEQFERFLTVLTDFIGSVAATGDR